MRCALVGMQLMMCVFCVLSTSASVAVAQDDARAQALVYFRGAREAYEAGEFQRSVILLEEAVELHDIASLHYNLARALQELGRWREARDEYATFLDMEPETPERGRVEARIAVLDETLRRQEVSLAEVQHESPDTDIEEAEVPAHGPRVSRPLPWIIFGAGVAALGGGVFAGALSRASLRDVRRADDHRSALVVGETAQRRANIANGLFISGGIVCATGLIWGLVARRRPRVEVGVGGSTIQLRGRF